MSSYTAKYAEYLQGYHLVLLILSITSLVMVVGWYLLRRIYAGQERQMAEWLYLISCASILVYVTYVFWRLV